MGVPCRGSCGSEGTRHKALGMFTHPCTVGSDQGQRRGRCWTRDQAEVSEQAPPVAPGGCAPCCFPAVQPNLVFTK